jgi:hypothetical protein
MQLLSVVELDILTIIAISLLLHTEDSTAVNLQLTNDALVIIAISNLKLTSRQSTMSYYRSTRRSANLLNTNNYYKSSR